MFCITNYLNFDISVQKDEDSLVLKKMKYLRYNKILILKHLFDHKFHKINNTALKQSFNRMYIILVGHLIKWLNYDILFMDTSTIIFELNELTVEDNKKSPIP